MQCYPQPFLKEIELLNRKGCGDLHDNAIYEYLVVYMLYIIWSRKKERNVYHVYEITYYHAI
jgi:hypothetical protein